MPSLQNTTLAYVSQLRLRETRKPHAYKTQTVVNGQSGNSYSPSETKLTLAFNKSSTNHKHLHVQYHSSLNFAVIV